MASVHVDFNDVDDDGRMRACYPDHVTAGASLAPGERVVLEDSEGNSMRGQVEGFENYGRGDLVRVKLIMGTWIPA
jgi:hypothetical protein